MPFRDGSRQDVPETDVGTADRRCRKNKRARGPQKLPDTRKRIPVFLSPAAAAAGVFPRRSARRFRLLSGHLFRGVRIGPDDLLPRPRAAPETISFFG